MNTKKTLREVLLVLIGALMGLVAMSLIQNLFYAILTIAVMQTLALTIITKVLYEDEA